MNEKEWQEFVAFCKKGYPMWSPDRPTISLYLKWLESKKEG